MGELYPKHGISKYYTNPQSLLFNTNPNVKSHQLFVHFLGSGSGMERINS